MSMAEINEYDPGRTPEEVAILNDQVTSCLECPICYKIMSEPIFQCKSGHSFCNDCARRLPRCSFCNESALNIRNLFLENVAKSVLFPCINADFGCEYKARLNLLPQHQNKCYHHEYRCVDTTCNWRGVCDDLLVHVRNEHEDKGFMRAENKNLFYENFNLSTNFQEMDVVTAFGKVFFYYFERNIHRKIVRSVVQYIGPEYEATNYAFQFVLKSENMPLRAIHENYTSPISDCLYAPENSAQGISITFETLLPYISEDSCLHFELNIRKLTRSVNY